jgi:hypothetical protein
MNNSAPWLALGLVGLWMVMTRSYAGYKGQETDSVADRLQNRPRFTASIK